MASASNASRRPAAGIGLALTSSGIHGWMGVPRHDERLKPIGTFNRWWMFRPKKYNTAEKLPTLLEWQTCQLPWQSASGLTLLGFATVNGRSPGKSAAAFSAAKLFTPFTRRPMFDWPEPSQTSPASTSWMIVARLSSDAKSKRQMKLQTTNTARVLTGPTARK